MNDPNIPKTIKDTGRREDFTTGSRRDARDGKGRFDLIPPSLLVCLAQHLEDGSKKYGDRNWERGQTISRYFDSAMRHLIKFWSGQIDEMHLHAAVWNLMAIVDTQEKVLNGSLPQSLDDHPCKNNAPLLLRAIRHVVFPDNLEDCWYWTGTDNEEGYGEITIAGGRKGYPHRIICEEIYGPPLNKNSIVLHSCGHRSCVNPRHLSWGSHPRDTGL